MTECPICKRRIEDYPTLHYAKCIINKFVQLYEPAIPKAKPNKNVSKILQKIMEDVKHQANTKLPKEFYEDGNFIRLLDFVEKILIFISENDGHYRAWLAWLLIKIQTELNAQAVQFNPEKYHKTIQGRLPLDPALLFYDYLAQHPTYKEEKNEKNRNLPQ